MYFILFTLLSWINIIFLYFVEYFEAVLCLKVHFTLFTQENVAFGLQTIQPQRLLDLIEAWCVPITRGRFLRRQTFSGALSHLFSESSLVAISVFPSHERWSVLAIIFLKSSWDIGFVFVEAATKQCNFPAFTTALYKPCFPTGHHHFCL